MPFIRGFCQQLPTSLSGNARSPFLVLPTSSIRICDSGPCCLVRRRPILDRLDTSLRGLRVLRAAWWRSLRERSGARRGRIWRAFRRGVRLCAAGVSCNNKNNWPRHNWSIGDLVNSGERNAVYYNSSLATSNRKFWVYSARASFRNNS